MSQNEVERTLGRLLTDGAFRADFFREPGRACLQLGLQLASGEITALLRVPRAVLANLGSRLDDRICRLFLCTASIRSRPGNADLMLVAVIALLGMS